MNSIKHKISRLVIDAKSTFYNFKVSTSSTAKELYRLTNNLSGKCTSIAFCHPTDQLPQVFSDFFVNKVRQIRDSIDRQIVHSPSRSLCERRFSGTPLCGFDDSFRRSCVEMHEKNCLLKHVF